MKWVEINGRHINTNNVDSFDWLDGVLEIRYDGSIATWCTVDPDKKMYKKLCRCLGILPYEEVE
jgi:hypothetical protein